MAARGFFSLPRLVLLLVVLGDAVAMAAARVLLGGGIAEAPSPAVAAEGPAVVAPSGGGRQDRSIAGAEVILAGFAAAVVAVIFLYIRVTRKSNNGHGAAEMAEKA
ncbi:uncharacterized protein [Lolium perenne]|uniref:uncharacterized protein n=1 Tax=Lolium perenne TaxID=4522 RepID=UPI0021EA9A08|nr:uncharacterized protein LOC127296286 [Lolium perenne]